MKEPNFERPAPVVFECSSYREYLKRVLEHRKAKNPAYSMRAMAKQLNMGASTLSEVLKGRRNISQENALAIAQRLGLGDREIECFHLLIQLEASRSPEMKQTIQRRLQKLGNTDEAGSQANSTFAVDPEQIDEAKLIMNEFLSKMESLAQRSVKKTVAYQIGAMVSDTQASG